MSRFIPIVFLSILIISLIVGFFYLKQTNLIRLPQIENYILGYTSFEKATQKAAQNCKNTGINGSGKINSYLITFLPKIGANHENTQNNQLVDLGNSCWGFWIGDQNGKGNLFWEDVNGKINKIKTIVEL